MLALILAQLDEEQHDFVSQLFYRYEKRVKRYAYSILNHEMDAEDCVLNTFVKIMDHIEKYHRKDEKYIERALFVICKNEAINIYRKKKRDIEYVVSMTYSSEDSEMDELELRDMNEDIEKLAITQYTQNLVRDILEGMDPKYSEILTLKYSCGMSNKQIAEVMGLTESAVGTRLSRAKQNLLEKGGEELYDLVKR